MVGMRNIIQFVISKGKKYYVAQGIDFAIVTQGKTLDELVRNIKEAVEVHFHGTKPQSFGLTKNPSVLVNFELPQLEYA